MKFSRVVLFSNLNSSCSHSAEILIKNRLHRVAVLNAQQELVYVCTQTNVVQYIHKNIAKFKQIRSKTVDQLKMGTKDVVCVKEDDQTFKAFLLMDSKVLIANIFSP